MLSRKPFLTLLTSASLMLVPLGLHAQAAQVTCKDGSMSASGKGACSGHGGIDKKATKAASKAAAKTDAKASKKAAKAAAAPAAAAPAPAPTPAPAAKPAAAASKPAMAAPAPAPAPKAAKTAATAPAASKDGPPTAKCKDGSMSYAKTHSGACSTHGGVAEWLDGTAKKP